jgi:pimeloyl-ACP methyl ester carboxylesterase
MLQKQGHAVVVPDLRGHGESTKMKFGGSEVSISQGQMRPADMNTVLFDVEAVRKFLLEKNNREELNISMLCVVGAEWGAVIAVNWVALDWNRPQLPAFKQGRDAKAIVLLSPPLQFKGVSSKTALKYPIFRSGLSIMLVAGKGDAKGNADAKAIYNQLERSHEIPSGTPEEKSKRRTLFLIEPETSLGGTELLKAKGLTVNQELIRFVWFRLVSRKNDFAWSDHKSPLSPE